MNMVGTPYSAVHRSLATAASVLSASNVSLGKTSVAPCVMAASDAMTMPKQWYIGTGTQTARGVTSVSGRAGKTSAP